MKNKKKQRQRNLKQRIDYRTGGRVGYQTGQAVSDRDRLTMMSEREREQEIGRENIRVAQEREAARQQASTPTPTPTPGGETSALPT